MPPPLRVIIIFLLVATTGAVRVDEIYNGLNRALDYFFENYDAINIDGLFGIVFAQAHLHSILEQNINQEDILKVKHLKQKADAIFNLVKPLLLLKMDKYNNLIMNGMSSKLWLRNIQFGTKPLNVYNKNMLISYKNYMDYLKTSNMSQELSDNCILELITPSANHKVHDCYVSETCKDYMLENDQLYLGYGITHRLLYLQIARSQRCRIGKEFYERHVHLYCSYILWEAKLNAHFGFMDDLGDLLLEQITLCGYEGYTEFLEDSLVEHVLNIQSEHGCFSLPSSQDNNEKYVHKRTVTMLTYGCNDHTSGLGISSLALMLRFALSKISNDIMSY